MMCRSVGKYIRKIVDIKENHLREKNIRDIQNILLNIINYNL